MQHLPCGSLAFYIERTIPRTIMGAGCQQENKKTRKMQQKKWREQQAIQPMH